MHTRGHRTTTFRVAIVRISGAWTVTTTAALRTVSKVDDLCHLLDEPTPADADPSGETYCFERGAFDQLRQYSLALENPPLLIVSDMVRFRIRTNWTNSVSRTHEFELDDLADASTRDRPGLVATNSIRGGANRRALQAATDSRRIVEPPQPIVSLAIRWSASAWNPPGPSQRSVSWLPFVNACSKTCRCGGCRSAPNGRTSRPSHGSLVTSTVPRLVSVRSQIRAYQVYLTNERRLSPSSLVVAVSALRFLYRVTLQKRWVFDDMIPAPKKPRSLPVVLSPEEVVQFLDGVKAAKHHAILTTCYAAGLRIAEAVRLTVSAIDSERMVLRIARARDRRTAT